jgi:hypothetical protein
MPNAKGEIFYQGAADYLQNLNFLWGRGPLTGMYAPTPGMSPAAGPNGFITPAWLDYDIPLRMGLVCAGPVAKSGYAFASQGEPDRKYYKLATLPASTSGTRDDLRIRGVFGSWGATGKFTLDIVMSNRDIFRHHWSSTSGYGAMPILDVRIVAFKEADESVSVYLLLMEGTFTTAALSLEGQSCTTYAAPVVSGDAPGTVVFDSSSFNSYPPQHMNVPDGLGGEATRFSRQLQVGDPARGAIETSYLAVARPGFSANSAQEMQRIGQAASAGVNFDGCWSLLTAAGNGSVWKEGYTLLWRAYDVNSGTFTPDILSLRGNGQVVVPGVLKVGNYGTSNYTTIQSINPSEGAVVLELAANGAFYVVNPTSYGSGDGTALRIGNHGTTNRSINAGGTINASGSDYAEYLTKAAGCGPLVKGSLVGITVADELTDRWADSVRFAIKSTDPSIVGGDTWSAHLGQPPAPTAGTAPAQPVRRVGPALSQVEPERAPETDDDWAMRQAEYAAALAAYNTAVAVDVAAAAAFDVLLQAARATVDRISYCGRVPVNVLGAAPGDYIVPAQDGEGIKGIVVADADITFAQYRRAVAVVNKVLPDGRAYATVKPV